MKASTTLRRATCIAATVLALTAAAGCRGGQYADDAARMGGQYVDDATRAGTRSADDAAPGGTKAGRHGERNGPSPGDGEKACKLGDELGDSDDSPCW
jgi:hypothetical protein